MFCFRSSDSDGAFETPESTTPVKAVSPAEPQRELLESDDKGTVGDAEIEARLLQLLLLKRLLHPLVVGSWTALPNSMG